MTVRTILGVQISQLREFPLSGLSISICLVRLVVAFPTNYRRVQHLAVITPRNVIGFSGEPGSRGMFIRLTALANGRELILPDLVPFPLFQFVHGNFVAWLLVCNCRMSQPPLAVYLEFRRTTVTQCRPLRLIRWNFAGKLFFFHKTLLSNSQGRCACHLPWT